MTAISGVALGLLLGALGPAAHDLPSAAGSDAAATALATQICSVCHGPRGDSATATYPKLAAQPQPYLLAKIMLLRNRSLLRQQQEHADVLGLSLIDDATARALAHYYARNRHRRRHPAMPI